MADHVEQQRCHVLHRWRDRHCWCALARFVPRDRQQPRRFVIAIANGPVILSLKLGAWPGSGQAGVSEFSELDGRRRQQIEDGNLVTRVTRVAISFFLIITFCE